jgi:hypothetical protein
MKKSVTLLFVVLMALAVMSCAGPSTQVSTEDVSKALAAAGYYSNPQSTSSSVTSRQTASTHSYTSPLGGSLVFEFTLDFSGDAFVYDGTVTYNEFTVEDAETGDTYVIDGGLATVSTTTITGDLLDGDFTLSSETEQSGSISISKNGGASVEFEIDLTSTSTTTVDSDGNVTVESTVTGTIGGETVDETITVTADA